MQPGDSGELDGGPARADSVPPATDGDEPGREDEKGEKDESVEGDATAGDGANPREDPSGGVIEDRTADAPEADDAASGTDAAAPGAHADAPGADDDPPGVAATYRGP